jgi:hypothetical protein
MFRTSLYFRLSGFYFWYFAFVGAFAPYFALYLQSFGYSPFQIATLMAVGPTGRGGETCSCAGCPPFPRRSFAWFSCIPGLPGCCCCWLS